jgi:glucose dehydrogenase
MPSSKPPAAKRMLAVLSVAVATMAAVASQAPPPSEWRYFGGNKSFTRYSPIAQINRDNVGNLRIAWRRPAVNAQLVAAFPDTRPNAYLRATPIMIDGVL